VPPDYWNFVHGHPGGSKQTRPLLPFEVVYPLLIADLPNLARSFKISYSVLLQVWPESLHDFLVWLSGIPQRHSGT
jgi:hypothetical protein